MAAAIIAVVGASIIGASTVSAQDTDTNKVSMVKQLAQKLGIEESKIQTAMDSIHADRQAEMQKQMEARLIQAVTDGKITEQQKQLILKKHQEIQAEREANRETIKNLTPEQRRAEMQEHKSEMEAWAKENGIDMSLFFGGMGSKGGMRGFRHMK